MPILKRDVCFSWKTVSGSISRQCHFPQNTDAGTLLQHLVVGYSGSSCTLLAHTFSYLLLTCAAVRVWLCLSLLPSSTPALAKCKGQKTFGQLGSVPSPNRLYCPARPRPLLSPSMRSSPTPLSLFSVFSTSLTMVSLLAWQRRMNGRRMVYLGKAYE